jgi:SAM-dependent methyltransferase
MKSDSEDSISTASPQVRACPACAGTRARGFYRQSFEGLSEASFLTGYDVVACETCGMAFADGIPSQDAFNAYYRELSKYEHSNRGGQESKTDMQRFRDIASLVKDLVPDLSARILEIGCATGGLLAALRDEGFATVQGVDPSPACAEAAWRLYRIPVFASDIFHLPKDAGYYDLVIAVGVIEHIEDLGRALQCVRDILAPDGRSFAEVPDVTRIAGRPDAPYQEFSIEHINFFSPVSLTNLFQQNGFTLERHDRVIRMQNESLIYPAVYGLYQKTVTGKPRLIRDEETEPALVRYIEESQAQDLRLRAKIEHGTQDRPILIWGTGTHTQRLLAVGAFAKVKIAAFVDSNPKYQHQSLHGVPVLAPSEIVNRTEPILISSCGFQREIRQEIQQTLGMKNSLILLYDE